MKDNIFRIVSRLIYSCKYNINQAHYLTLQKIINSILFKKDFSKKNIFCHSFPPGLSFQASAFCNTNCQLCPIGINIPRQNLGFLNLSLFKKIIDENQRYLSRIYFGDWGEPFLNPNIFEMIHYAESKKIETVASTNFHAFQSDNDLLKLINSNLSRLMISMHGASQATYEAYQPGKNLQKTIEKIKNLNILKKYYQKTIPRLELIFTINKKNVSELKKMEKLAKELFATPLIYPASINVRFYKNHSEKIASLVEEWVDSSPYKFERLIDAKKEKNIDFYSYLVQSKKIDFDELDKLKLTGRQYCRDPWESMVVNWDGKISLCCVDFEKYVMGDADKDSLIHIWNNDKYIKIRQGLANKDFDIIKEFPCYHCIRY